MNNYILINRTFSETTPESAEVGDFLDSGFISEKEKVSFSELVALMEEHREASCSGEPNLYTWYSTGFFTSDYRTGTEREECIHFCKENTPNVQKYWKLARKAADNRIKRRYENLLSSY
jgi:hypothetical protein